ncbi:MAG: acetyl-CoA carboxylase biotin carboxyl carrier protein [Magnetospirillum sp. WYHS-4]
MTNKANKMDIDADLIRTVADILRDKDLSEIEVGRDDWYVRVARGGPAPAPMVHHAPAPVVHGAPAATAVGGGGAADPYSGHPGLVVSPMVGVVYTSPEPGTPPFVKVGDTVSEGDTLVLIEAMKVFNPIKSPRAGRVVHMMVSSEDPVEYGEPLLVIE